MKKDKGTIEKNPDIAERNRAKEALSESMNYTDNLINYANAPIIVWDPQFRIIRFNHAFESLTGRTEAEVIGQSLRILFPPDRADASTELIRKALLENKRLETIEINIIHRDGSIHTVIWNSSTIFSSDGKTAVSTIAQGHDITERKKSEKALSASEMRYRRLFETAQDGILILDAGTGAIIDVNPFLMEMLGYSHEQFIGKAIWELGSLKDIIPNRDNFLKLQQQEYIRYEDLPLETSNGRRIDVEFVSNVYLVDHTNVIQCNIRDITERKQAEEALKKYQDNLEHLVAERTQEMRVSEMRYRRLFETTQDGVLILDAGTGTIIDVNPFLMEMLGYSHEQFVGKSIWDLGILKDVSTNREKFAELQQQEYIRYEDLPLETRDGRRIDVEFVSNVYLVDHTKVIQCNIRDITERKRIEKALSNRTAELEVFNKELETFSYSISHDLQAPLRTIDGFSHALLEDYAEKLDSQGKDYLMRVRSATQRMSQLIDDLLNLSRITRIEMNIEKVNLTQIAWSVIKELQKSQPERLINIKIADGLEDTADPGLMGVVLENILENAWKFTVKQPEAVIEFGSTKEGEKIVYFIRDNGAGFDMAYADKLFSPFQRLHTTEEYAGTGIGLATVCRIIHRHGGNIRAEGQVGEGATFYFSLQE